MDHYHDLGHRLRVNDKRNRTQRSIPSAKKTSFKDAARDVASALGETINILERDHGVNCSFYRSTLNKFNETPNP